MAQYLTGAVTIVGGTNIVTGVADDNGDLPLWLSHLEPGDEIVVGNDLISYQIASVDSDTQLTLTGNYPTSRTAADYVAFTDFTIWYNLPKISNGDTEWPVMFNRAMQIIDQNLGQIANPISNINTYALILSSPTSGSESINIQWDTPTFPLSLWIPTGALSQHTSAFILSNTGTDRQFINSPLTVTAGLDADVLTTELLILQKPASGEGSITIDWTNPGTDKEIVIPELNNGTSFPIFRSTLFGSQAIEDDIEFGGDIEVAGEITGGQITEMAILHAQRTQTGSSIIVTGDDCGKIIFGGYISLPDANNLPKGWSVTIVLGVGGTLESPIAGNINYSGDPSGSYAFSTSSLMAGSSGNVLILELICDSANYLVKSLSGWVYIP